MSAMYESLIIWFQTLNLKAPHSNIEDLSDGVALAEALNQFAPESFTDVWLSKIKTDAGNNWRLKMSNLKKVIEGLYDYYNDILNYSLVELERPDAMRIAEKYDSKELGRLLQMVLGCAVNCPSKQEYIRKIMCLEMSLQANIMQALQDLESTGQGGLLCRNSLSLANFDFKMLQDERDRLAQKNFEFEKKLTMLIDENTSLRAEIKKLQEDIKQVELAATIDEDCVSLGPAQAGSTRYNEMRRQLDNLKDELLTSETSREDLRLKSQQQETQLQHLQERIDDLNKTTSELNQLKDEVDILRETNEKLKICEAQVNTYKKKLKDYNDLKRQIKVLEERSEDYIQQIAQFEEDVKKYATLKGQVEHYKKEIKELHIKLDEEMGKNVKIEFDNKYMENIMNTLYREKENLLKERDSLRETIDELKCGELSTKLDSEVGNTVSKELQPTALIEKLKRIELENKALREGQGGQTALMQLLDDANKRNENLREQLKSANERIMSLTHASANEDANNKSNVLGKEIKQLIEINEQKAMQYDECVNQNVTLQSKISQLENTLSTREQELIASDNKYRKCIEKAKEIIKNLDPRLANVMDTNPLEAFHEPEEPPNTRLTTMEENLMTTAFYRLAISSHRDAIDSKLALLMGQGHTFLTRQRQPAPRKSAVTIKNK